MLGSSRARHQKVANDNQEAGSDDDATTGKQRAELIDCCVHIDGCIGE